MNRVKKYRLSAGLTQSELARLTGLTRGTIYSLEKNGGNLQKRTAALISEALKVPVRALIGEEEVGYQWQDNAYTPDSDGEYLVAYKPRSKNKYSYAVLKWDGKAWWEREATGNTYYCFLLPVLWWSKVCAPPI